MEIVYQGCSIFYDVWSCRSFYYRWEDTWRQERARAGKGEVEVVEVAYLKKYGIF